MTDARRVIIFDDFENAGRFLYRDCAAEVAEEEGWTPEVFESVRSAQNRLSEADDVGAVVTTLGRRARGTLESNYPGMSLIYTVATGRTPLALISEHPNASRYIRHSANNIVVPKQPYELIAPTLHNWFKQLVTEPT